MCRLRSVDRAGSSQLAAAAYRADIEAAESSSSHCLACTAVCGVADANVRGRHAEVAPLDARERESRKALGGRCRGFGHGVGWCWCWCWSGARLENLGVLLHEGPLVVCPSCLAPI